MSGSALLRPGCGWRSAVVLCGLLVIAGCAGLKPEHEGSLYQRLGAQPGVNRLASELVDALASDAGTSRSFDGVKPELVKKRLALFLCQLSDGPCRYDGGSMRHVHRNLDITEAEFATGVGLLQRILDRHLSTADKNELLRRLAPMKREIATGPFADDWDTLPKAGPGAAASSASRPVSASN